MNATTILVLDDEPFIRMNLATYLEDEGFNVLEAATAEHALQLLETHEVSLVVVDLRLPGIDGASFIRFAKMKDDSLQFIIHTGSLEYRLEENLKALGLKTSDIFCKPVKDMVVMSQTIVERLLPRLEFV